MKIVLDGLGKRYIRQWVFRNLSYTVESGECLAITGPNGAGKSTLLKIISTYSEATKGTIKFFKGKEEVAVDTISLKVNYAAPYLDLIEEMTLRELLSFHSKFRKPTLPIEEMTQRARLSNALEKQVYFFSSGMKQRTKLILAFYFESDLLLLDEPTSNMDEQGIEWYREEIQEISKGVTTIIASNSRFEFDFTDKKLDISNFK
jgi:ABC-type multidrug transport system ATPase subunit